MTLVWLKRVCYLRISKIEIHLLNELKIMQYIFEIFSFKLDPLVRDRMNQNLKFITKLLKHVAKIMNISLLLAQITIKSQKGDSKEVSAFNTSGLYPWIIIHSIIE